MVSFRFDLFPLCDNLWFLFRRQLGIVVQIQNTISTIGEKENQIKITMEGRADLMIGRVEKTVEEEKKREEDDIQNDRSSRPRETRAELFIAPNGMLCSLVLLHSRSFCFHIFPPHLIFYSSLVRLLLLLPSIVFPSRRPARGLRFSAFLKEEETNPCRDTWSCARGARFQMSMRCRHANLLQTCVLIQQNGYHAFNLFEKDCFFPSFFLPSLPVLSIQVSCLIQSSRKWLNRRSAGESVWFLYKGRTWTQRENRKNGVKRMRSSMWKCDG